MKYSTKVVIVACLAILLAFSLSLAFAGNEKTNATKNMTNVTKNMTNVTKNMTNVTKNMTNVTKNMTNATKNMTNATKNMTNATKNMTNATNPFAKVKGVVVVKKVVNLNSTSNPTNETHLMLKPWWR